MLAEHSVASRRPLPDNRGMKWIGLLLVVAAAGYLGYKYLYKPGGSTSSSTSSSSEDAFIAGCRQASQNVPKVEEYCACLRDKGVKSMAMLATNPTSREAMLACQEQVGHTAPGP